MKDYLELFNLIWNQIYDTYVIKDILVGIVGSLLFTIGGKIGKNIAGKIRSILLVSNSLLHKEVGNIEWLFKNIIHVICAAFSYIIYMFIFLCCVICVTAYLLLMQQTALYRVRAVIAVAVAVGVLFELYKCTKLKKRIVYILFVIYYIFLYFASVISLKTRIMMGADVYCCCLFILITCLLMNYYKEGVTKEKYVKIYRWLIFNFMCAAIVICQIQLVYFYDMKRVWSLSIICPLITYTIWLNILFVKYKENRKYKLVTNEDAEYVIINCKKCNNGFYKCMLDNTREKIYVRGDDIKYIICSINKKTYIEKKLRLNQKISKVEMVDGRELYPYYCTFYKKNFNVLYFEEGNYDSMYYVNNSQILRVYIKR